MFSRVFVGHHGTKSETAGAIFSKAANFAKSENYKDWLGTGIYFWNANPERAYQWIQSRKIPDGKVIEATIDARNVLDINLKEHQDLLRDSYKRLVNECRRNKYKLPINSLEKGKFDARALDCAVLDGVNHHLRMKDERTFDVCVGVFEDGVPVFRGSAIRDKSHTQICVYDEKCIVEIRVL